MQNSIRKPDNNDGKPVFINRFINKKKKEKEKEEKEKNIMADYLRNIVKLQKQGKPVGI